MNNRLKKDIEFIIELDKMKSIHRMTSLIDVDEKEDDAQHSWHISVMAMVLEEYADEDVDIGKVIKMLLVHDIVEIYAGDTFAYDKKANEDKRERELKSADKIFGILDDDKANEFRSLWDEFEAGETKDALFAIAMDRLQPMMLNYYNNGGTWTEHDVKREDIYKRLEPVKYISKKLWNFASDMIEDAASKGQILK